MNNHTASLETTADMNVHEFVLSRKLVFWRVTENM